MKTLMTQSVNINDRSIAGARQVWQDNQVGATGVVRKQGMLLKTFKQHLNGQYINKKHLLIITSQLSVRLSAGCDLCAGLDAMSKQEGHPRVKVVMADLRDSVK